MDKPLGESEDEPTCEPATFNVVTPRSEICMNEDDGCFEHYNMSCSSYSEPSNRITGYPLHNETWANTVPVTKKDKSEKLHNWRAAGRAIRRMLTKGILPSRSSEMYKNKATRESVVSSSDLNESSVTHNDAQLTGNAMNEMYSEFENSQSNLNNQTQRGNESLCRSAGSLSNDTVDMPLDVKQNEGKSIEMNGTVSSVLKSLGMSSESFNSQCQSVTGLSCTNESKQQVVRPKTTHSDTLLQDSPKTHGNDSTHISTLPGGTKKRSPTKDTLNWHDLKQRITRLTQRSKKKHSSESQTESVQSDVSRGLENTNAKLELHEPTLLTECSGFKMDSNCETVKTSKRHKHKSQERKTRKDIDISSDEENGLTKSVHNKIKSKHKQSNQSSHIHEPFISLNSPPEWHVEGLSLNHPTSDAMILPAIPRTQTSYRSTFPPHTVSPSHCSIGLEHTRSNRLASTVGVKNAATNCEETSSQCSTGAYPEAEASFLNSSRHVMQATPYALPREPTASSAVAETRHLWEDRPIFPTANILFDSSLQYEGFEDHITVPHPFSQEGVYSRRNGNGKHEAKLPRKHCKLNAKKKTHPKHKRGPSLSKRENTKEQCNSLRSKHSPSTSDSCGDGIAMGDGARCKTHHHKKTKRRRELVSIYSTGGGDMNMHGSQENLAELCPHRDDQMCTCMLQFLNEKHTGSSGDAGESSLEEKAHMTSDVESAESMPRLLSSSSEGDLAAQLLMDKLTADSAAPRRNETSSVPELIDTDESDFYDDILPDVDLPGSDDEKEEPVELSPRELQSLPQLRSSSSSSAGSQADDEFECECEMCQHNQHLYTARNNSWITEEEEEYPGTTAEPAFSIHYHLDPFERERDTHHDPFNLDLTELNPMDLLLMRQGRRDLLEVMFQNVILQMLAVYPELLNEQAPPPLDAVDLDNIPVISIDTDHMAKDATCPICLCEFEEGEDGRQLGCQHLFHKLCVEAWLVKSGTCPVCRLVLSKKPAEQ